MAYNTKKMLEDVNGDLIPQWYDPVADEFKPLTNEPQDVRLTGSNVVNEYFVGTEVTAGSNIVTEVKRTLASDVGIGARTIQNGNWNIDVIYVRTGSTTSFGSESMLEVSDGTRGFDRLPLKTGSFRLQFNNIGETDVLVHSVNLTEFY